MEVTGGRCDEVERTSVVDPVRLLAQESESVAADLDPARALPRLALVKSVDVQRARIEDAETLRPTRVDVAPEDGPHDGEGTEVPARGAGRLDLHLDVGHLVRSLVAAVQACDDEPAARCHRVGGRSHDHRFAELVAELDHDRRGLDDRRRLVLRGRRRRRGNDDGDHRRVRDDPSAREGRGEDGTDHENGTPEGVAPRELAHPMPDRVDREGEGDEQSEGLPRRQSRNVLRERGGLPGGDHRRLDGRVTCRRRFVAG